MSNLRRYGEHLNASQRVVALAVRGYRTPAEVDELRHMYRLAGSEACREAAQASYVEALVGTTLEKELEPGSVPNGWKGDVERNSLRVKELVATLRQVVERLESKGCQTAVVEGGGGLLDTDVSLAAYPAGDFDLLVRAEDWPAIQETLIGLGFSKEASPVRSARIAFRRGSSRVEVAYKPFERTWGALDCNDRPAVWLARRVPALKNQGFHVLAPSDALLLLAVHASLHSFFRAPALRLYVDIDRLARRPDLNWQALLEEAELSGATTRAFVALMVAQGLLGSRVPDWVLLALHPVRKRWLLLRLLLRHAGVITKQPSLFTPLYIATIELLVAEGGPHTLLRQVFFPPRESLTVHPRIDPTPSWRLYARRLRCLVLRARGR